IIWEQLCNPNFSFQTMEDIYARFVFPWHLVEAGERIIIYGGGVVGKTFLQQLARCPYCHVMAICDKNPASTGIVEAPLVKPEQLAAMDGDKYDAVVIAIERQETAAKIKSSLIGLGVPEEKIRWSDPARKGKDTDGKQ
ncbi:MAG: hypothetical protein J6N51_11320, partial [Selenomonas sp.]|nr:hypothetical protein [Selenomonas sp.]